MSLISNIRLWTRDHARVKASGRLCIAEAFEVEFTLLQNDEEQLFVGLPRRSYVDKETKETKWVNQVFCLDDEVRKDMTKQVIEKYKEIKESGDKKKKPKAPF